MQNNQTLNPKSSILKPNSTIIKVQNLIKTYKLYREPIDRLKEALNPFKKSYHNDFYALKDVSFEIKKGETVGIIGRNGSGKSTLLKIITGVLTPSKGRAVVNGKISAILELGAGFNPEMSGLENIYLNTSINGMSKQDTDKKIEEILDFAELGDFIYQPLKSYSSGMKARLGFAVAINIEPDILIVDEALAVGDAAFQRKCFAKMEAIRKNGATILFVSHSEGQIVNLCSRAIWLSNGEKIIEGNPKLVTGLYVKNANKKVIDKTVIQKEMQLLEKNLEKKDERKKQQIQTKKKIDIEEFYDTSLISKSKISYEEKGAKLYDFCVKNSMGEQVNTLTSGKTYFYCYKVKYLQNFKHVRLGMNIKTANGIVLGGGQYPHNETKDGIEVFANREYSMCWSFKCLLREGAYFFNSGTFDIEKQVQLHRVLDAYMFKVVKPKEKLLSAGIVHLIEGASFDAV